MNTLGDVARIAEYLLNHPEMLARPPDEPANDNAGRPTLPCEVHDVVAWYRKHPMEAARDARRARQARRNFNSRSNSS